MRLRAWCAESDAFAFRAENGGEDGAGENNQSSESHSPGEGHAAGQQGFDNDNGAGD